MSREKDIPLEQHGCEIIRKALLIGLASFGEIERIRDFAEGRRAVGTSVDEDLVPLDHSGRNDTICIFAEALMLVSAKDLSD